MQKYLGATYWCELKIAAVAATRVEGLEELKREIPGTGPHMIPILYGDNESAVGTINKSGRLSMLSRSIAKDIAVPCDMVVRLVMVYIWIKTEFMIADIGTKFVSQAVYKVVLTTIADKHLRTETICIHVSITKTPLIIDLILCCMSTLHNRALCTNSNSIFYCYFAQ